MLIGVIIDKGILLMVLNLMWVGNWLGSVEMVILVLLFKILLIVWVGLLVESLNLIYGWCFWKLDSNLGKWL